MHEYLQVLDAELMSVHNVVADRKIDYDLVVWRSSYDVNGK